MIGALNNNYQVQNKTNFGAVTRVVGVHVNGKISDNPKDWDSLLNHTINVLMMRDKAESKSEAVQAVNGAIRLAFDQNIDDYRVPPAFGVAKRTLSETPKYLVRWLEDNYRGIKSLYILTGKDATKIEKASEAVKEANSIRPFPEQMKDKDLVARITAQREEALLTARHEYGLTAGKILSDAKGSIEDVEIFGTKGKRKKDTKVTPVAIKFRPTQEMPKSAPQPRVTRTYVPSSVAPSPSNARLVSEGLLRNDRIVNAIVPQNPKGAPKANPNQTDLFA